MGVVNLTFAPLHSVSPRAAELIDNEKRVIEENIKARNYHPGLVDQYRLMLERLDRKEPGWEFLGIPVYLSSLRMLCHPLRFVRWLNICHFRTT